MKGCRSIAAGGADNLWSNGSKENSTRKVISGPGDGVWVASSHFGISSDAPVFCCGRDQTGVPRKRWSVVRCGIYHKDLVGCGFFFFIFSSALRNRRAGSVWSCAVVLHFEAVQELSGPRASKLIRVPERMRSFCNYFGHVDRSFPVGRRDSVAICGSTLSFRQRGWRDVKILAACLRYEPQACYTPRTSRSARLSRKYPERSFFYVRLWDRCSKNAAGKRPRIAGMHDAQVVCL